MSYNNMQFQRTWVWTNGAWSLKHSALLPAADLEPTSQEPADAWTHTWYKATPPPYIIWERWLFTDYPHYKGKYNGWDLIQSTRNWK